MSLKVKLQAHPPESRRAKGTSALFKQPIPFFIPFPGLTSGYPHTPSGNGHSLDRDDDEELFLFLEAISSDLHCLDEQFSRNLD